MPGYGGAKPPSATTALITILHFFEKEPSGRALPLRKVSVVVPFLKRVRNDAHDAHF